MHFNIRGFLNQFKELKEILSLFHDIKTMHCIMLCETFLTDSNYVFYTIPGYKLVCSNRQTGSRGGVAMYIRDDLNYIICDDISVNINGKFESIFVEAHSKTIYCVIGEIIPVK